MSNAYVPINPKIERILRKGGKRAHSFLIMRISFVTILLQVVYEQSRLGLVAFACFMAIGEYNLLGIHIKI